MRQTISIMEDWLFTAPGKEPCLVQLPHTWNAEDGQDGGNNYFRGTCIYEKKVSKPEYTSEQCVYLQFHGVNASARVVVNGHEICNHHNGYSTFRAEVTSILKEENEIRVEVDNGKNDRVYPQLADFTFYGGIYREVEFLIVSKAHFDLDSYGGYGVFYWTKVRETLGIVRVHAFTNVKDLEQEGYVVDAIVEDADGKAVTKVVSETNAEGIRGKNKTSSRRLELQIEHVHLWNGVNDPYLYRLRVQLKKLGITVDEIVLMCGVRSFYVDPNKGFFLNGKSYPLHGVARHQDVKGIGNAVSKQQMEEDMELIREVGANSIRLAHYQHASYFYDLCDRYGMVVWAEIPYISAHMPSGKKNTFLQMRELIVQNFNHLSIVTWGLSNEITISPKHRKDMLDNHYKLQKLVKKLDPTRLTTLACFAMCSPFHPVSRITDLVGWNLYLGWYVPGLYLNDLFMEFYHKKYPHRPLGYSEYGAEGMPNLHSSNPRRGDHSEEYQAKYHEYMLECFKRHPFLWSTYVWNMFDFAADAREQGGEPGMNHKGLVTFDRKIKKDSFYLYKAWWSNEPFVHLCGKRYEYRSEPITTVTVYSNQPKVSLYHNGRLMGEQEGEHVFRFQLPLEAVNRLEARTGELCDKGIIYKTKKPRTEYKVKKGRSQNWV